MSTQETVRTLRETAGIQAPDEDLRCLGALPGRPVERTSSITCRRVRPRCRFDPHRMLAPP